jgi:Predicted membrane protein
MTRTLNPLVLKSAALILLLILAYTGVSAGDKVTWLMEAAPVMIVVPLLWFTHLRYPLTPLLYTLIFFHAIILMVGEMYTYAKVPIGFDVQAWFGLSRNPYDKLGHLFQGLVPALVAREILIRGAIVRGRRMPGFIVCCIALAISAFYELIEWWAALAMGQGADDFPGYPGRSLGYPVRYVLRADRFTGDRTGAGPLAQSPVENLDRAIKKRAVARFSLQWCNFSR